MNELQYSKQQSGIRVTPAGRKGSLRAFAPEKQLSPMATMLSPPVMVITEESAKANSPSRSTVWGMISESTVSFPEKAKSPISVTV